MTFPSLIVELQRGYQAPREQYAFERSPVRIGRGPRNDLAVDHVFVSHCHGVLHFDEAGVEFVDLGSTNGSYLDGARLRSHECTPVHTSSTLTVGPLRLRVRLELHAARERDRVLAASGLVTPRKPSPTHIPSDSEAALASGSPAAMWPTVAARLAQSFLDLSHGQRRWREELGLPATARQGLQAIDDPRALVEYLLAGDAARLDELSEACAELTRCELALVQALGTGARELLEELAPSTVAPSGMTGVVAWLSRLFGHDPRWTAFERRHRELQEDTMHARVVFGRSFRKAYAESSAQPPAARLLHPQPEQHR